MKQYHLKTYLRGECQYEGGFTLLELLISLTILALFVPILFGGFSFGARVWERTERAQNQQGLVVVRTFLKRQLRSAALPMMSAFYGSVAKTFSGQENELLFVASLPQSAGTLGRGMYVLKMKTSKEGLKSLIVLWRPEFTTIENSGNIYEATEVTLIENVRRLSISYFGFSHNSQSDVWAPSWSDSERLPQLVRIAIEFPLHDKRKWQPLIVAPAITADSLCEYDPVSRVCKVGPK